MRRSTPSYQHLRPSSAKASKAAAGNRSQDTKCEVLLRSALWKRGLRFRKNVRELPGKPDVVFPRARVVVFCDGDFWHGRNLAQRLRKLRKVHNSAYWIAKIKANVKRDRRHDSQLTAMGWSVVRVWESDVLADPATVAAEVAHVIARRLSDATKRCPPPGQEA